jgi:hypothetical protein
LKGRALSKFRLWESVGKPWGGGAWYDMKQSKLEYKNAIQFYGKAQHDDFTEELADNLAQKNIPCFWKSWNSKFSKNRNSSKIIENCTSDSEIADEFRTHFAKACAPSNIKEQERHKSVFYDDYTAYDVGRCDEYQISVCDVEAAMSKLKLDKAMVADNLAAEYLLNAHPSLICCLTSLFNYMLYTGYVPDAFGLGVMIALHKDSGLDPTKCDNYRCLTISSVMSKLFEYALLDKFDS